MVAKSLISFMSLILAGVLMLVPHTPAPADATVAPVVTAAEMAPTQLPSVYLAYGEQAWTRPEFDYTLHGGAATLLALPPDSYDCVLLFPFGYAAEGNPYYEFERALRFTENVQGIGKLLSLQRLLDRLHEMGKSRSQIRVYLPGFFSSNAEAWNKLLRPPTPRREGVQPPQTFEERLWQLLMYLRTPQGEPRCVLVWDGSGDMQNPGSTVSLAIGHSSRWNFDNETEAHSTPGSSLQMLRSVTTAWMVLESPQSFMYPVANRDILCNNLSGIGDSRGVYRPAGNGRPAQPIGMFGLDHRRNYVPQWRERGHRIYIHALAMGRDGTPPAYWFGDDATP